MSVFLLLLKKFSSNKRVGMAAMWWINDSIGTSRVGLNSKGLRTALIFLFIATPKLQCAFGYRPLKQ